jgi:hypothetical protein
MPGRGSGIRARLERGLSARPRTANPGSRKPGGPPRTHRRPVTPPPQQPSVPAPVPNSGLTSQRGAPPSSAEAAWTLGSGWGREVRGARGDHHGRAEDRREEGEEPAHRRQLQRQLKLPQLRRHPRQELPDQLPPLGVTVAGPGPDERLGNHIKAIEQRNLKLRPNQQARRDAATVGHGQINIQAAGPPNPPAPVPPTLRGRIMRRAGRCDDGEPNCPGLDSSGVDPAGAGRAPRWAEDARRGVVPLAAGPKCLSLRPSARRVARGPVSKRPHQCTPADAL